MYGGAEFIIGQCTIDIQMVVAYEVHCIPSCGVRLSHYTWSHDRVIFVLQLNAMNKKEIFRDGFDCVTNHKK